MSPLQLRVFEALISPQIIDKKVGGQACHTSASWPGSTSVPGCCLSLLAVVTNDIPTNLAAILQKPESGTWGAEYEACNT